MLDFDHNKHCYSCRLCESICPKKIIRENPKCNKYMPLIDDKLCISCGKCNDACLALNTTVNIDFLNSKAYIAINKCDEERFKSSSGGIFILLAKKFISNNGYVCGCIYDENNMPKHILTNNINDVYKMMGSKYVQSDLKGCYSEIEEKLSQNKNILFSGVPCQIAAMQRFIRTKKVFYVAITCHGTISRDLWKNFLKIKENDRKKRIIECNMRGKDKGWKNYGLSFLFEDGSKETEYRYNDGYFLKCYTKGLLQEDRCLECNYKIQNTAADIFLGDGWGVAEMYPELDDQKGVSIIILNTKYAFQVIKEVQKNIFLKQIDINKALSLNPRLTSPSPKNKDLYRFRMELKRNPNHVEILMKKYTKDKIYIYIYRFIRNYFKNFLS